MIGRDEKTEFWQNTFAQFLLDMATATMQTPDGTVLKWTIVQHESEVDDFVAIAGSDVISAALESIRVTPSGEGNEVLFVIHTVSRLITGTCEATR